MIPLNWELDCHPATWGYSRQRINKEGAAEGTRVTDLTIKGESSSYYTRGAPRKYVWNAEVSLGGHLVFPCSVIKVNGNNQAGLLMTQTLKE